MANFANIAYSIPISGELDIAKIYKVFSRKGMDVNSSRYNSVQLSLFNIVTAPSFKLLNWPEMFFFE